eukprot:COSAG06_NODE_122_length_23062_cov_43.568990_4_plen_228_part_00
MPSLAGLHPLRISPNAGAAEGGSALSFHLSSIYLLYLRRRPGQSRGKTPRGKRSDRQGRPGSRSTPVRAWCGPLALALWAGVALGYAPTYETWPTGAGCLLRDAAYGGRLSPARCGLRGPAVSSCAASGAGADKGSNCSLLYTLFLDQDEARRIKQRAALAEQKRLTPGTVVRVVNTARQKAELVGRKKMESRWSEDAEGDGSLRGETLIAPTTVLYLLPRVSCLDE